MKRRIYLDNAATTAVRDEVFEEMIPYFKEKYGNPSSSYSLGQVSKVAIDEAREVIAKGLGAKPREIYFTSGGTESDNWAIKGAAERYKDKGMHIITSTVEHHAVLHTCQHLEKQGYEVTYLPVDPYGSVCIDDLEKAIRDDTILISIMYANNEIGTIQPIKEIGALAKEHDIIFHTDAVQAIGDQRIDVDELGIDMLSISAHKFYGPKGVGALYIRRGIRIPNLIDGGAQEFRRRAGTENIPGIVGMAKAYELINEDLEARRDRISKKRDYLIEKITSAIDDVRLNGHPLRRLANNVNICFNFVEGESMLLMLDMVGIEASSGSACTSGSLDPSHVLLGIGLEHGVAHGSLRLTLSDETTYEDLDYVVEQLVPIIERLRMMSPLYNQ